MDMIEFHKRVNLTTKKVINENRLGDFFLLLLLSMTKKNNIFYILACAYNVVVKNFLFIMKISVGISMEIYVR